MAVYLAASDEASTQNPRTHFVLGGYVWPVRDWEDFFAPAWAERVLDGPPRIEYFHMVDMRSGQWRRKNGFTALDAERRIDEAVRVVRSSGVWAFTAEVTIDDFTSAIGQPFLAGNVTEGRWFGADPDYVCFLGYARNIIEWAYQSIPDCERVEFVVESNGKISRKLKELRDELDKYLRQVHPHLAPLLGQLVPAAKRDSMPLQAADLACWHLQRFMQHEHKKRRMTRTDGRRLIKLMNQRYGKVVIDKSQLSTIATNLLK